MYQYFSIGLLLFSSLCFAAQELKSKDIKNKICTRLEQEVTLRDETVVFETKKCQASAMNIIASQRDPRLNEVTMMTIQYNFDLKDLNVSGQSIVITTFTPGLNGELTKTWSVRSVQSTLSDKRNVIEMIKEEVQVGDYNMGNGNMSVESKPGFGLREARKELTQMLENGSCKYETYSGIDSTFSDWAFKENLRSTKLGTLLQMANKQGKLKAAVHRIYADGESEYCSHYYYIFIFTDSTVLYILIDQTT
jgi:hypothetical protein